MKYTVKIIPKSSKNEIVEYGDDFLKIKIKAVPERGKANEELIKFLSKYFEVSKSSIRIINGEKRKNKIIEIL